MAASRLTVGTGSHCGFTQSIGRAAARRGWQPPKAAAAQSGADEVTRQSLQPNATLPRVACCCQTALASASVCAVRALTSAVTRNRVATAAIQIVWGVTTTS